MGFMLCSWVVLRFVSGFFMLKNIFKFFKNTLIFLNCELFKITVTNQLQQIALQNPHHDRAPFFYLS
jgi:hypothetical protein